MRWALVVREHLRARAAWVGLSAVAVIAVQAQQPPPPARSVEGVAALLGAAVGGDVRPDDFVWEPRGGLLRDALLGRQVLFLAHRRAEGDPAPGLGDLYRARVRLTRSGRPVSLDGLRNLTASPLGDERDLVARGRSAAFVTFAFGAVQGVTVLDLGGDGAAREARTWSERLRARVESALDTGSFEGLGRREVTFAAPPPEARIELADGALVMALGTEGTPAALDLASGALDTGGKEACGARAQGLPHAVTPWPQFGVETVHRVLGGPAARASRAFLLGWRRRFGPRASTASTASTASIASIVPEAGGIPVPSAPAEGGPGGWPPPKVPAALATPLAGEGVWSTPESPLGRLQSVIAPASRPGPDPELAPPSPLYETTLRPDPLRPECLVHLVALDTRRLALGLQAGFQEPRAGTGLHGPGRIEAPARELVAAFAAGPADVLPDRVADAPEDAAKAPPALGAVVEGRVLVPAVAGAATVALTDLGRTELGAWPLSPEPPAAVASLFQTPDPLLGGGGARVPLADPGVRVARSAVCLLPGGYLLYAWGADLDAATLARALERARCGYALPLAAGPARSGLSYLHAPSAEAPWEELPAAPGMTFAPLRPSQAGAVSASPNAFFTAWLRDPRPTAPLPSGAWVPDPGRQPPPAWLPAVHHATVVSLGAQIHLASFAPERFTFRLRAGGKELSHRFGGTFPEELPAEEVPRIAAAIGVGTARKHGGKELIPGLALDGSTGLAFHPGTGVLSVSGGHVALLLGADFTPTAGGDATELPLTAEAGKLRAEVRETSAMRPRAAACVLGDGTLLIATTTFDSDEAATTALLETGCTRVVALDRGTHRAAFLHRAGTEPAPEPRYEGTTLYALDAEMPGRAGPLR